MHMQARMQAWDGGEGKIKNLRKGIAEVSLSKAATVPFQTQIILVSREHPEDSLGNNWREFIGSNLLERKAGACVDRHND